MYRWNLKYNMRESQNMTPIIFIFKPVSSSSRISWHTCTICILQYRSHVYWLFNGRQISSIYECISRSVRAERTRNGFSMIMISWAKMLYKSIYITLCARARVPPTSAVLRGARPGVHVVKIIELTRTSKRRREEERWDFGTMFSVRHGNLLHCEIFNFAF